VLESTGRLHSPVAICVMTLADTRFAVPQRVEG